MMTLSSFDPIETPYDIQYFAENSFEMAEPFGEQL